MDGLRQLLLIHTRCCVWHIGRWWWYVMSRDEMGRRDGGDSEEEAASQPPKDDDVVHSDQADRQTGIGIDGWWGVCGFYSFSPSRTLKQSNSRSRLTIKLLFKAFSFLPLRHPRPCHPLVVIWCVCVCRLACGQYRSLFSIMSHWLWFKSQQRTAGVVGGLFSNLYINFRNRTATYLLL